MEANVSGVGASTPTPITNWHEAARILGCSVETIHRARRRAGVLPTGRRPFFVDAAELVSWWRTIRPEANPPLPAPARGRTKARGKAIDPRAVVRGGR